MVEKNSFCFVFQNVQDSKTKEKILKHVELLSNMKYFTLHDLLNFQQMKV